MSKTLIQTVTVGAGGAASIDFTNIPQIYTDLMVVFSLRGTVSAGVSNVKLAFNGSTSGYSGRTLMGFGSGAGYSELNVDQYSTPWPFINFYAHVGSTSTANVFSNGSISVPNYATSSNKSVSVDWVNENNAASAWSGINTGLWSNSAAITSLTLGAYTGSWVEGSSASLYGVNRIAPSGSGATPTVEYLVVAGGGGGHSYGGGGGAGGLLTASSFAVASGSALTVTVGGGGAASSTTNVAGTSGSNSVFSSITASGGGGGGAGQSSSNYLGLNGGSGGGGGTYSSSGSQNGGTGTAGQGNAGGTGNYLFQTWIYGGGGGGAGGAGANSPATSGQVPPAGGVGLASTFTGNAITYAKGGSGRGDTAAPLPTGGVNSGGGGNGGYYIAGENAPNAGSSGVVVIRYPDTYANPTAITGNPVVNYANGYKIYTWTASGSITF